MAQNSEKNKKHISDEKKELSKKKEKKNDYCKSINFAYDKQFLKNEILQFESAKCKY